jgi:hypothetical protein
MRRLKRRRTENSFNQVYMLIIFIAGIVASVQFSANNKAVSQIDEEIGMAEFHDTNTREAAEVKQEHARGGPC